MKFDKGMVLLSVGSIVSFCFFAFLPALSCAADVTLTVGNGLGLPGSADNPVEVSLDNSDDQVRSIQMDVCDGDDYLSCMECATTERTSGFLCSTEEQANGCCRVILFDLSGGSIAEGKGSVCTIKYNVSEEAPSEECINLNPEELSIRDEDKQLLEVTAEPGEFCFSASSTTTTSTTTTSTTTTPSISISPAPMWKSRWISLPYLMVIAGNNTHFKRFNSRLSFEPPLMVFPCFPIVWDSFYIWDLVLVMPGWLAGFEDQTVTVTVTTGDETVEDDFEVKLLPFILTQNLQSTTSAHKEPFLK